MDSTFLKTIIDVQFIRTCDLNALVKRIEKLKAVKSITSAPYREDYTWHQLIVIHNETMNDQKWNVWLYNNKIKGLDGYGACPSTTLNEDDLE